MGIEHIYLTDNRGFSIRIVHDTVHVNNWESILAGMVLRRALTIRHLMPELIRGKIVWGEI